MINIGTAIVSQNSPPSIIAEISANHNGSIQSAKALISAAKNAGADAVKIQTYTADTLTLNSDKDDFIIQDGLWSGRTLYDLYEEGSLPWEWHKDLFDYAHKVGITIFSTPFDENAVDFLHSLNAPAYKIASFECIDLPLIEYVARKGKPMIISTGMASLEEILTSVEVARSAGCKDLIILHCISAYPALADDYNLKTLEILRKETGCLVGLSDHTIENHTAIAAVALGACLIEKHFTLDRNGGGPDDSFSLLPNDLSDLCVSTKAAWRALGRATFERVDTEKPNVKFRRSLYFTRSKMAGEVVDENDIRSIRPGFGLLPKYKSELVGRILKEDVSFATAVQWSQFEE